MMNNEIMVSVICPTFNQGKYLQQGLESILMQKVNFKYEVLIGEDCSPDNTNELLKPYEEKYPDKIHVFHREKNLKQSKNIYDLFMRAQGRYVITLDLDDYWSDENKLQRQVDWLENYPEYAGVAHDFQVIDKEGNLLRDGQGSIAPQFLDKPFTLHDFEENTFVYQTGTFLYRNLWKDGNDYSILYKSDDTVVDLAINPMVLLRGDVFIMKEKMSMYRRVISTEEEATNARSIGEKDLALDLYKSCKQLQILYKYFDKKVDCSVFWSTLILAYLKNMIKLHDKRYSWGQWLGMFFHSSGAAKRKVMGSLLGSTGRKFNSH